MSKDADAPAVSKENYSRIFDELLKYVVNQELDGIVTSMTATVMVQVAVESLRSIGGTDEPIRNLVVGVLEASEKMHRERNANNR